MDIHEIKSALTRDAGKVVRHLLPHGKQVGRDWCVGSTSGETGNSLKVCISGAKAGVWADFAEGSAGDIIDLWAKVKGITLTETIIQAKNYIGYVEPGFLSGKKKSYKIFG